MRVYLDACCLIYIVEGSPAVRHAVVERLARLGGDPTPSLFSSGLSRLECRTKPLRDGDHDLLARYESLFSADRFELTDIGSAILDRATVLRAEHGFKTPDALHLATAIEGRADAFLTGDARLSRCAGLRVEVISAAPTAG